jgi:trk system potassium uptake protein TrkA
MKTLVIGAGEVGMNLARTLVADGQDVSIIEKSSRRINEVAAEIDALMIKGNGASPRMLREVDVGAFDLVAAVTTVDEVNVISALISKQAGVETVVARVRDPEYFDEDGGQTELTGIDFVIDPDRATAESIAQTIEVPGAVSVEYFADGRLALAEVILGADSPLVGQPLSRRARPLPAYIVGIQRQNETILARPDSVPEPGDHILVSTASESLREVVADFVGEVRPIRSAILFGGGRIGLPLAHLLEQRKVNVTVLEKDRERADEIAGELRRSEVIDDEGISQEIQEEVGVSRTGAFVACAGDDRSNLVAALNAKRMGAGLSLATISREEFLPLVDAIGLDGSFSPRLIAAEEILKFVHTTSVKSIRLLRTGFEAMEIEAGPGSEICGMAIGETHGVLSHCRVGAVLHEDRVEIPVRGMEIEEGDTLLVLGPHGTMGEIESSFAGKA